jgi:hypothetical protein
VVEAVERARAPVREQPIVFRDRESSLRLSPTREPTIVR